MRSTMIAGALVLIAAALGCEVRTGSGAYSPPPPGAYRSTNQVAANSNPPPPPMVVSQPAAQVQPSTATPAPAVTQARNPSIPTVAPSGTSSSGIKWRPPSGGDFGAPGTGALKGTLYWIPETTQAFPDVTQLQPQGTIWTNELAIPMHDFEQGFPGVSNRFEWFAIRYEGTFHATKPGIYTFGLNADDGANLYIDGAMLINNDGRHLPQEKDASTNLNPGNHTIRVDYFKGLRWVVALQLYCTPPGGQKTYWTQTM